MIQNKIVTVLFKGEEYTAMVEVETTEDSNYGADADGNRGIPMTFIDNINVIEINKISYDGNIITIKPEEAPKGLLEVIENEVSL